VNSQAYNKLLFRKKVPQDAAYFYPREILYKYYRDVNDNLTSKNDEFGDGSEWMLSKCLTHANRTFNLTVL
jgi:hypothetical protein